MADKEISQVTINNEIYNICDKTAREYLVSKKGDTLTGNLISQDKNIISKSTNLAINSDLNAATTDGVGFAFYDKNNSWLGRIVPRFKNSKDEGLVIDVHRTINNEEFYNSVFMGINDEKVRTVSFSHPKAWRDGLSVIANFGHNRIDAGDSAKSSLTIHNGFLQLNKTTSSIYNQTDATNKTEGNIYIPGNSAVYYSDYYRPNGTNNTSIPLIGHNGANLWIGAHSTNAAHHSGQTLISTGWVQKENSNNKPITPDTSYSTIYVSVPKWKEGQETATNYGIYHRGNLPQQITYVYHTFNIKPANITGFQVLPLYNNGSSSTTRDTNVKFSERKVIGIKWIMIDATSSFYLWTECRQAINDIKNTSISDLEKAKRIEEAYYKFVVGTSSGSNYAIPYQLTPGVRDDTIKTNNVTVHGNFLYYTNKASNNVIKVTVAYICIPWVAGNSDEITYTL